MPKPLVTGISPKEGYPGTKVIIRGEFLGKDEADLVSVKICGVDCTLRSKWEKESRITTYTGFCIGKGDIIITTHSGGVGTSSVGFQGLVKKNIGLNEESCVWIEEDARSILTGLKRQAVADILHDNPLKISVDESSKLSRDFFDKEFPNCMNNKQKFT
jgi:exocyst complex component 2